MIDEQKNVKNEKPIVVNFSSTNELNARQAVRLIIESHRNEESSDAYVEYREAL